MNRLNLSKRRLCEILIQAWTDSGYWIRTINTLTRCGMDSEQIVRCICGSPSYRGPE